MNILKRNVYTRYVIAFPFSWQDIEIDHWVQHNDTLSSKQYRSEFYCNWKSSNQTFAFWDNDILSKVHGKDLCVPLISMIAIDEKKFISELSQICKFISQMTIELTTARLCNNRGFGIVHGFKSDRMKDMIRILFRFREHNEYYDPSKKTYINQYTIPMVWLSIKMYNDIQRYGISNSDQFHDKSYTINNLIVYRVTKRKDRATNEWRAVKTIQI
jgi:hypothetical protein